RGASAMPASRAKRLIFSSLAGSTKSLVMMRTRCVAADGDVAGVCASVGATASANPAMPAARIRTRRRNKAKGILSEQKRRARAGGLQAPPRPVGGEPIATADAAMSEPDRHARIDGAPFSGLHEGRTRWRKSEGRRAGVLRDR